MSIYEKFAELAKKQDTFVLKTEDRENAWTVMSHPYGPRGRVYYAADMKIMDGGRDYIPCLGRAPIMAAVKADDRVYFKNAPFGQAEDIPLLEDVLEELAQKCWECLLVKIPDRGEAEEEQDNNDKYAYFRARECLIKGIQPQRLWFYASKDIDLLGNILVGNLSVEAAVDNEIARLHRGPLSKVAPEGQVIDYRKTMRYFNDPDLLQPWEKELAASIRGRENRTFEVHLAKEGGTAVVRVKGALLMHAIHFNISNIITDFCDADGNLIAGVDRHCGCDDITQVLYHKIVVYSRQ